MWKSDADIPVAYHFYYDSSPQSSMTKRNICIVGRLFVVELWSSSSSALRIWALATPKYRDFLALHVENMSDASNARVQSPLDCVLAVTLKHQFITIVVPHKWYKRQR